MYRTETEKQLSFEDFYLPFGSSLNPNNRWIQLSKLIPWSEFEKKYAKIFSVDGMGAPAKSFRLALGSLMIKEKLRITVEETVEQIRENHYLQFLIGMEGYRDEEPFDPSMAGRRLRLLLAFATGDGTFQKADISENAHRNK